MTFCRIFAAWARFSRWDLSIQAVHCKDTIPKIRNKNSQKRNRMATVPIPKFMFPWAIYIFPWSVCLFCSRTIGGPNVVIYRSLTQTHECGNYGTGRAIPFLGIHKSKFLCSVGEVLTDTSVPPLGFVSFTFALTWDRGRFQRALGLPHHPSFGLSLWGRTNLAAAAIYWLWSASFPAGLEEGREGEVPYLNCDRSLEKWSAPPGYLCWSYSVVVLKRLSSPNSLMAGRDQFSAQPMPSF
jgi:hypothetical protein